MRGWLISDYIPEENEQTLFDSLLKVFQELLMQSGGNAAEALAWLTQLDNIYKLTNQDYTISDFIEELKEKGFLKEETFNSGKFTPTSKMNITIRKEAFNDIFGKIKKTQKGNHNSKVTGRGEDYISDLKSFEFGDKIENIAVTESLKNSYINNGIDDFMLTHQDLEVHETYYQSKMSTVLMIDISHSMILYGEDRITPAKKVAMALAEFIRSRYPKDSLDVLVFGNDAWPINIEDLPYLEVGPYHTNTVAGLELALDLLRKRRNPNKQVFLITDGKPTCIKKGKKYYKNPFGLDRMIMNRTLNLATRFRKLDIPITTFMIASDPYLQEYVELFTRANNGKAFYSDLNQLGEFILRDYKNRKDKRY
ncbi:vWA domain-containing protein [Membranihabitans maritimus]|uniref:vWA domain-containing protein n=1 Tax=Membranihabitans maritimus TaxID=2904244 RepID=UPI001F30BE9A|nr:VWA domain-containing protein [Membranihabitans maritimus]